MTSATAHASSLAGGQFLACQLATVEYGITVVRVRQIFSMIEITALPRTPDYVLGVLNLHGRVLPVVDLRRKFGIEPTASTAATCIVVVDAGQAADGAFHVGCVVDGASEVVTIAQQDCGPAPSGAQVPTDCIAAAKDCACSAVPALPTSPLALTSNVP